MFIHLPVIENRIAQFAARFEPYGAGWVYQGDRLLGGVPVSDAERTALVVENERILRRTERVMRWWLPVAVILCLALHLSLYGIDRPLDPWLCGLILLLPMPWVALQFRRADRLALDLAGRRVAVAPPRSAWGAARSRLVALPASVPVMLFLVSAVLAFQSRPWRSGEQRLWLGEALVGLSGGAWLMWLRCKR